MKYFKILPSSTIISLLLLIGVTIFSIANFVWGFTEPTAPPPGGNVSAPLNVSGTAQTKAGILTIKNVFVGGTPTATTPNYSAYTDSVIGNGNLHLSSLSGGNLYLNTLSGSGNVYILPNGGGNVGIGTPGPSTKLFVQGVHGDTRFRLFSDNYGQGPDGVNTAHLSMWASEPGCTWGGVGIGNNITNWNGVLCWPRITTTRGGSYIRLLDNSMLLNVVDSVGTDRNAIFINGGGNVGIGGDISISSKHAFRGNDTWLRLNQDSQFSSGVYTPGLFRADGDIFQGGQADGNRVCRKDGTNCPAGAAEADTLQSVTNRGNTTTQSITAAEVYSNGWLRNTNAGAGLYNQATGNHLYAEGNYWTMAKAAGNNGLIFRNGYAGPTLGYVYSDGTNFGLLASDGNWRLSTFVGGQTLHGNTNFPGSGIWNTSGNVGIGTTNFIGGDRLTLGATDGVSEGGQIGFRGAGTNRYFYLDNFSGRLRYVSQDVVGESEKFTILNNGNVGIGTTEPARKLQIDQGTETGFSLNERLFLDGSSGNTVRITNNAYVKSDGKWALKNAALNAATIEIRNSGIVDIYGTSEPGLRLDTQEPFWRQIASFDAPNNLVSLGNINVRGNITFDSQKICSSIEPGNWRDVLLVPASWSRQTCINFATSTGAAQVQLGCIFKDSYAWGNSTGVTAASILLTPPSPNCGW